MERTYKDGPAVGAQLTAWGWCTACGQGYDPSWRGGLMVCTACGAPDIVAVGPDVAVGIGESGSCDVGGCDCGGCAGSTAECGCTSAGEGAAKCSGACSDYTEPSYGVCSECGCTQPAEEV